MNTIVHADILEKHDDGTDDWHDQRADGIGGSDAPVVLGMKPYGVDRHTLWQRKLGREAPFMGNAATDYGTQIEPYVFERAAQASDRMVVTCDAGLAHPERPWQRGHVDGLVLDPADGGTVVGVLELKTSSQPLDGPEIPDHHYAQIQHYLAVTGLGMTLYAHLEVPFDREHALEIDEQFIPKAQHSDYWEYIVQAGTLTIRTIERNPDYIERLTEAEQEFWAAVQNEEEPGEYLREGEIELDDPSLMDALEQYGRAKARMDAYTSSEEYDRAEAQKEAAKGRAKSILSSVDAKKVHLPSGDKATYTARGYWRLYPEDRSDEICQGDDDDSAPEIPF